MTKHTNSLLLPICWVLGHNRPESEGKPGWFVTKCTRCGRKFPDTYWFQQVPSWIADKLVKLAQKIIRADDFNIGYHRIDNHDYIDRKYLQSLVDQDGDKGWGATVTLKEYLLDKGWVSISDFGEDKFLEMLNSSLEKKANKQEREKTMKIMKGELPREDE